MTTTTTFKDLGLIEPLLRFCEAEEFVRPTEIQEKAIPHVLAGKDVIGEASTGSGKTLAFSTAIIQQITKGKGVQALVVTPTRELALQVAEMIRDLSKYISKRPHVTTVYGGVSINPQIDNLRKTDVVVGTPGRLIDHIQRRTLKLKNVKVLVLDECDRLLDMGFIPDVERIVKEIPTERQTLLFSATIPFDVIELAQKYMVNPVEVTAEPFVDPKKLKQYYYGPMNSSQKFSLLVHLLKKNKTARLSLIFSNTRRYSDFISKNLNKNGIKSTVLHGGLSQHERQKRLMNFQKEGIKILVATDVAARGLDIPGVTHVYNYDLPENKKQYIHRIGRTARAGEEGKAITMVNQQDTEDFIHFLRGFKGNLQKIELPRFKSVHVERQDRRRPPNRSSSRRRTGGFNKGPQRYSKVRKPTKPKDGSRYSI